MFKSANKIPWLFFVSGMIAVMLAGTVHAGSQQEESKQSRQIDVVLALDVSGSMSGLIDSAKQRLWDIVNELGPVNTCQIAATGAHFVQCKERRT